MAGLGDYPVAGVIRADDYARAAKFYTEVLGFTPVRPPQMPGGTGMFAAGAGTMVTIYERPGMPAPQNTTLGFGVPPEKFDEVLADLRSKGVTFEEYDIPEIGLKTVDGVADVMGMKSAWFLDSEDNILNVVGM